MDLRARMNAQPVRGHRDQGERRAGGPDDPFDLPLGGRCQRRLQRGAEVLFQACDLFGARRVPGEELLRDARNPQLQAVQVGRPALLRDDDLYTPAADVEGGWEAVGVSTWATPGPEASSRPWIAGPRADLVRIRWMNSPPFGLAPAAVAPRGCASASRRVS
jgi:hypothetical protein